MQCLPHGGPAVGYAFDRWMIFATGGLLHRPNLCGMPGAGGDYDRSAKGDIVRPARREQSSAWVRSNSEALTFGGRHSSIAIMSAS